MKTKNQELENTVLFLLARMDSVDTQNGFIGSEIGLSDGVGGPEPGRLSVRSDDSGPLEAVISQLAQKVTQVDAGVRKRGLGGRLC